ncbi:MAG: RAMP superfamily CRISPR-associated protein [Thermoprotei archaeon]
MFQKIYHKTFVRYELLGLEYLHVGAERGGEIETADLPQLKYGGNVPYIPGSTIKGVLRHMFLQLFNSLGTQELKKEFGVDRAAAEQDDIKNILAEKEADTEKFVKLVSKSVEGSGPLGIVDLLFGSPIMASPIVFTDAVATDSGLTVRTHVKIDPDKESAESGALVQIEAANPKTSFKGLIVFNCIDIGSEPTLLHRAFNKLIDLVDKQEVYIGGWKSRGYGRARINILERKECTPEQIVRGECKVD